MQQALFKSKVITRLSKRRVRYPAGNARLREGCVTGHDPITRMVVVLDDLNGTFWRGPDADVEVIV
ncbi:hypothetical protein [Paraburkholderia xenovorans]